MDQIIGSHGIIIPLLNIHFVFLFLILDVNFVPVLKHG